MAWSSSMASLSCGSEALTLGSLMMLASGRVASSPSSARASGTRCASVRWSGKAARMRPAREMSRVSTSTPGGGGEGLDDGQEGARGQGRRLVGERVDDLRARHRGEAIHGARARARGSVAWPWLSHPLRRVRGVTRSTRGLAAVAPDAQRKRATSTSALRRVPPREPRRQRLLRPVHGPHPERRRHRRAARAWSTRSTWATPARWTACARRRWRWWSRRRPTSPARPTRRSSGRATSPPPTSSTSRCSRTSSPSASTKLEAGGRIAVNVANLGRKPYRSLSADVIGILQDRLGLLLRGEVVWRKARGAGGNCAWGSFKQPANPVLRDLTERVVIASKGRFDRAVKGPLRAQQGLPFEASTTADEFMDATLDVWELAPESATRVGHPAPFPVELPAAADRPLHLPRATSCSTRSWARAPPPSPRCAPAATTSATTPTRATPAPRASAWPPRWRAPSRSPRRSSPTRRRPPPATLLVGAGFTVEDAKVSKRRRFAGGLQVDWIATDAHGRRVARARRRRQHRRTAAGCGGPTCCSAPWARRPCSPPPATGCWSSPPTSRRAGRRRSRAVAAARGVALVDALELGAVGRARPPGGLRRRRRHDAGGRAAPRSLSRPVPSAKTEITEIVTGLAITGAPTLGEALAARCGRQRRRRRCGRGWSSWSRPGQHRQEFARRLGQRPGVPPRGRGPARPAAAAGRVEGPHPRAGRRGGAGRPPRRPRVAGQLQVPVEGARQRRAEPPVRPRPGRRARAARRATGTPRWRPTRTRRSTRPCGSSSAPGRRCPPHAATSRPRTAPSCAPTSTPAGRPRRRPPTGALAVDGGQGVGRPLAARTLAKRTDAEAVLWRLLRIGSAPVLRARRPARPHAAPPGDDPVGLAAGLRAEAHRRVGRRRRPAPGAVAGPGPRAGHRRGAHGRRPRRGPLEPRPLRQAPGGQGLPRHPPPPGPRLRPLT